MGQLHLSILSDPYHTKVWGAETPQGFPQRHLRATAARACQTSKSPSGHARFRRSRRKTTFNPESAKLEASSDNNFQLPHLGRHRFLTTRGRETPLQAVLRVCNRDNALLHKQASAVDLVEMLEGLVPVALDCQGAPQVDAYGLSPSCRGGLQVFFLQGYPVWSCRSGTPSNSRLKT